MIVVGTDGAADLPTRSRERRGLWESPDFRTLLSKAREPEQLVVAARERYDEVKPHPDDLLLVAARVRGAP